VLGWWGRWSGDVAPAEQCGADEQDSGTPPTLGITRPVRHRPSGHKPSRPHMPQGVSAGPPTAYRARAGRTPAQRRPAAGFSTHKRASNKTPGPARPSQPARYGAARTAAARRTAGGSRTRTAAPPAPPRTRRPPPAGQVHDSPKPGHSVRAGEPQARPLIHAVFGRDLRAGVKRSRYVIGPGSSGAHSAAL